MKVDNIPVGTPATNGNIQVNPQIEVEQNHIQLADSVTLALKNLVSTLTSDVAELLQQRDTILLSLPIEIQPAVQNILQKNMPRMEDLSQGTAFLAKLQKNTTDQLQQLLNLISDALNITEQIKPQLPDSLQQALRTYTPMNEGSSSVLLTTDELISMAKQLLENPSSDLGTVVAERIRQLWQQSPLAAADTLPEVSQKALNQFVDVLLQHVPETLKQAAVQYNLKELPDLWALLQARDSLKWSDMTSDKLNTSLQSLRKLVVVLQKQENVVHSQAADHHSTTISMTTQLYVGDGTKPYPAYIHIFHEWPQKNGFSGSRQYETWIHVCLQTEHAGAVDIVFRLYQQDQLDVRVSFSTPQVAQLFNDYLPDIKAGFRDFALHLSQISVNSAAEEGA